jgi:catechol 2,3-dioxygenase-like lactoylglutathione lyase family enzyme
VAIDVLFAGIPVAELEPAIEWYERFLGAPPDMAPNDEERTWRLTDDGWVYVVEDIERAGNGLTTLIVDDLDERIGRLKERGIEPGEVEQVNEGTRAVQVRDPDGNRIQLADVSSTG